VPWVSHHIQHRLANLADAFGFAWDKYHFVGVHGSKVDALSSYDPTIWVEDNFGHAVAGATIGHRTFLLDRVYNSHLHSPLVKRVNNWKEIAEIID
jgi:uncharacterized HAD superfamily protein